MTIEVRTDIKEIANIEISTTSKDTPTVNVNVPSKVMAEVDTTVLLGPKGDKGNGIASITKTSTSGLVDTYTITFTEGNTTTFDITNGNGIVSIEKTSTEGLIDTYTITLDNGDTTTFEVTNGQDGTDGIDGIDGEDGFSPIANVTKSGSVATISITDESGTTIATVSDGEKGETGEQGEPGEQGVSVTGVTLISTVGLDKTYRMTFSNGTYFDYVVSNGAAGATEWGGISGTLSNQTDLQNALNDKQDELVSGTNIKTINGNSVLGSGNLLIESGLVDDVKVNGTSVVINKVANIDLTGKQNITDNTLTTTSKTIVGAINELDARPSAPAIDNKTITKNASQQLQASSLVGLTSSISELNYTDGVTSNIQTQLDSKADANITANGTILNTQGKSLISGLSMPSDNLTNLTVGASGTIYTAPANGYFIYKDTATTVGAISFENLTNTMRVSNTANGDGWLRDISIPAKAGDIIRMNYQNLGTSQVFRFVYTEGEEFP